jgi:hypothetical protein
MSKRKIRENSGTKLSKALLAATISCSGKTIRIECNDHDTKDTILSELMGARRRCFYAKLLIGWNSPRLRKESPR